ncbi:MAG: polysaccharide deacetylase family protein, partial [Clostridia bacterium]|nr:polysaccharide deacetylase family protein [Clostridia bacterium]
LLLLSLLPLGGCAPKDGDTASGDTGYTDTAGDSATVPAITDTAAPVTEEADTADTSSPEETTRADTTQAPESAPPVTDPPETQSPPVYSGPTTVTYDVPSQQSTYTGFPSLPSVTYTVNDPNNANGLSSVRHPFSYGVASQSQPHSITVNNQATFDSFGTNALAWDNKSGEKVLYLTFDCGYKYGDLTSRILDTLKEKNVKAAFFCTMDYLKTDPGEVARMISEGHTVGNHSVTHPDCTTISRERLAWELLGVHNYMRAHFGYTPKYFRFPTGAFSESALELCSSVGYRSVFWSVAYADWDPQNQQGTESAYAQVTSRLHPGAVILLHSTSPDNADILARVIDYAHSQGYVFKTLDNYSYWKN